MLDLPHKGVAPDMLGEVRPLLGVVGLDKARIELDATEIPEEVGRYMVALCRTTRELPGVELGVSSRGLMHLAGAAKAMARLNGRDVVTVEDVREIASNVLGHRLILEDGIDHRRGAGEGLRARSDAHPAGVRVRLDLREGRGAPPTATPRPLVS